VHSWIFRNRRRLERLYGLAPARPEPGRDSAPKPAGDRARPVEVPAPLPARVLVPRPRRVA
jgi:hypothetical protein